jgi:Rrf2 family protein
VEYSLICLTAMGSPEAVVSTRDLAEKFNISLTLLRKIFHFLQQAGVVDAVRGPKGGYRLARNLDDISVQQVVQALRGEVALVDCLHGERCEQYDSCTIRENMAGLQGVLDGVFGGLSLREFSRLKVPAAGALKRS